MTLKRWHWAAIILASIALIVMAPSDDGSGTGAGLRHAEARSSPSDRRSSHGTGRVELELLAKLEKKQQDRVKVSDVFNQTSWYVAPPPPPVTAVVPETPPPPPAPTAPPLPFTYLGRYGDTDARTVVLANGDRVYTVKVGDIIDKTYRVEKFTFGRINLTYLPLNLPQSLLTGEAL
jgi:hypothetical protein